LHEKLKKSEKLKNANLEVLSTMNLLVFVVPGCNRPCTNRYEWKIARGKGLRDLGATLPRFGSKFMTRNVRFCAFWCDLVYSNALLPILVQMVREMVIAVKISQK
jgi:hypothetical protein